MSEPRSFPDVDYLTRDYEGFRLLLIALLDRSGTAWTERASADVGITLVEILAHQLDLLAYAGDRVAEESFLSTARSRESVRRHAMLGDYQLDRGCATSGYQHFELATGKSKRVTAAISVSPSLAPGQDPTQRLIAETIEASELDFRRNSFVLERSAPAGSNVLHLSAAGRTRVDLKAIKLNAGSKLVVGDEQTRELVTVRKVQGNAVELVDPLQNSFLAGEDSTVTVKGNLARIRQGRSSGWQLCGEGGAALDEVGTAEYCAGQIEQLRRLRAHVESMRILWQSDTTLQERWALANDTVELVARRLRTTATAALSTHDVERLSAAAIQLREIVLACNSEVPNELRASVRVSRADQRIEVRSDSPTLWFDGANTLSVKTCVAGEWTDWTEVKDFLRSYADDRHYVVEIANDGHITLKFGNGTNGARLPTDCQVVLNQVTGELDTGDLGSESLNVIVGYEGDEFVAGGTTNPLPTAGWRPPEPLHTVPDRLVRAQRRPVVPVTLADYAEILNDRVDVAETAVWLDKLPAVSAATGRSDAGAATRVLPRADVAATLARAVRNRVNIVIRPVAGQNARLVLQSVCDAVKANRLCGTLVRVTLAEPLHVTVRVLVELHPEIGVADLRLRLRRALLDLLGTDREHALGCARTCAEVYAVTERVPGVLWSQVVGFDRANASSPGVQQSIAAARNRVICCLDLPGEPRSGEIVIWVARRYRLEVQLAYADPDKRPSNTEVIAAIRARLSGPDSRPVKEGWGSIAIPDLERVLSEIAPTGQGYRLTALSLMVEQRRIERLSLDTGDVPVLDYVQIRDKSLAAHYRLELEVLVTRELFEQQGLREHLFRILAGPQSVPATEEWPEITASLLDDLFGRDEVLGGWNASVRVLAMIASPPSDSSTRPGFKYEPDRLLLDCGAVPVLDALHLVLGGPQ